MKRKVWPKAIIPATVQNVYRPVRACKIPRPLQRRIGSSVDTFRAIWEFAHSRNPEIAQAISGLRNKCAQSQDPHATVRPTASDLLCSSQDGRHP